MTTGVWVVFGSVLRRATSTVLVLCAVFLAMIGMVTAAAADTDEDARLVFCLSPERHDELADAAAALGLADRAGQELVVAGERLTPDEWRSARPGGFQRACAALWAIARESSTSAESGGFGGVLLPVFTGFLGALLAFVGAVSLTSITRGHALADDLRNTYDEFGAAVEAYVGRWDRGTSTDVEVSRLRSKVLTQLARVRNAHRWWRLVKRLEATLATGPLSVENVRNRTEGTEENVRSNREIVLRIARALEHPLRPHPTLLSRGEG